MHATSGTGDKARVGGVFPTLELTATSGQLVTIPDPAGNFLHLQLRRFAGCPIGGRLAALKYGQHAYDQWTVDELLGHAHLVPA
jgi:hypothetical protein